MSSDIHFVTFILMTSDINFVTFMMSSDSNFETSMMSIDINFVAFMMISDFCLADAESVFFVVGFVISGKMATAGVQTN